MNLTENQIKRIKPLLTKLVNEVKAELKEAPLNNWADDAKAIGGDVKLGMYNIQFLPTGGLAIRSTKASLVFSDNDAKKLAKLINDIIGK